MNRRLSVRADSKIVGRATDRAQGKVLQRQRETLRSAGKADSDPHGGEWSESHEARGQYADGLITDPKTWKEHKAEFESGARAAGKDPAQIPVLVELFVVVGDENEAKASAELWRFIPKAFKTYYNVRDPQAIQDRATAELPLPKVYGDWPVSRDPAVHIKAITDLFQSGANILNIHSGQADQNRVIRFYGKNVLPKVKSASKAA